MKSGFHGDGERGAHYEYTEAAVDALASIGPVAVPTLLDALEWRYEHTADYAALALGRLTERRAVPTLVMLLRTPWDRTRHHAAQALAEIGDRSALPALREALGDRHGYVRVGVAEALWQLGDKAHLSVIAEVLLGERTVREYDWEREEAALALARIGTPDAEAPTRPINPTVIRRASAPSAGARLPAAKGTGFGMPAHHPPRGHGRHVTVEQRDNPAPAAKRHRRRIPRARWCRQRRMGGHLGCIPRCRRTGGAALPAQRLLPVNMHGTAATEADESVAPLGGDRADVH
jgi:hypothetical protein